ncbi:MAG: hypothetical protein GEU28_10500 [Dehalococcoidia bacterium]|nr:hypothetical protein [Dehalococcoidia bacterium]
MTPSTPAILTRYFNRRAMLRGSAFGAVGLAGGILIGCGDDDDDDDDQPSNGADATDEEATPAGEPTEAEGTEVEATEAEGTEEEQPSGDLERVTFIFPFGAPHAGLLAEHYVAQDRGYFADEGLEEEVNYQTALLPLLAGGTVDYGRVTVVNFLNAFAAGQHLKAVFQTQYPFVFGLVSLADGGITDFSADNLRGEAIGVTEFAGGEVPMVRALLTRLGLVEGEDVELFPTSGTTQQPTVDALQTGRIVAFAGSILDFAAIETFGVELQDITPDIVRNINADDSLGVQAEYLEQNREQVVRYCRALAKGCIFAQENPRAAAQIGLQDHFAPDTGNLDETEFFIDLVVAQRGAPPEGLTFGQMPVDGWEAYQNFLLEGSTGGQDDPLAFDAPLDLSEIIDNTIPAEALDFDLEAIRQEARDFQTD